MATKTPEKRKRRFVLALDGGGAKGLYQLYVLDGFERRIPGINKKFDFLAGTSVGALVAATIGLKRMTPQDLINRFRVLLGKVFDQSLIARSVPWVDKNIVSSGRLLLNQPKYGAEVIEKELLSTDYFGWPEAPVTPRQRTWADTASALHPSSIYSAVSSGIQSTQKYLYGVVNNVRDTMSWVTGVDFDRRNTDWKRSYPNAQTMADYPPDLENPDPAKKIPLVAFVSTDITSDQPSAHVFRNYKIPVSHKALVGKASSRLYHYSWYPEDTRPHKKRIWEVLRASTAAPSYFPAIVLENERRFTDGGLVANNPAEIALHEALLQWPDDHIVLVSIGCGAVNPDSAPSENGVLSLFKSWRKPLLAPNILTASEGIHERVELHLQTFDLNVEYFRFDPPGLGDLELDNVPEITRQENVDRVLRYLDSPEVERKIQRLQELFDNSL